ncbi:TPA: phage tail protein [Pseudomonas aeruginosa]|nr:phage tail protein [Pseudomonas aeruginosa]HEC0486934.1 phage tail protein [Pseudomonas aeruginosa]HEC1420439.1 phage tail protein [Pseudomonas aeruginosa]
MRQQMALGEFVFGLAADFTFDRLSRSTSGGWVDLDIISSKPLSHQTGQGLEQLRLSGTAFYASGMGKLDDLRAMANARVPYALVDGLGRVWGRWRIDKVEEQQRQILDDGTAQVVEWSLDLQEFVNK